tara:strand:- start:2441 stop:3064 length:624 start_codon:yes stop_codon:yes gene_type:complete
MGLYKVKNLYINGCSFTHGNTLPKHETWPYLLSKETKLNLINESKNGQSFGSIFYNSINTLSELDSSDTIVVIGFTWETRYMIQFGNETSDVSPSILDTKNEYNGSDVQKEFGKYYRYLAKHDDNLETNQRKNLLTKIISLQGFLKQENFEYRFINFNQVNDFFKDFPTYDKLDWDNIIHIDKWTGGHPSKENCIDFTKIIYDSFNR